MLTDSLSQETLQRYITSREKIDQEIDFILAFTSVISQYKDCSGDAFLVDLYALGYFNAMLHSKVHDIIDTLDDFLPLLEAKQAVIGEENKVP